MTLPALSIPEIPLPLEIPELLHPAIVHFAIAIPIVVLLLELYNLGVKRRSISLFSLFLLVVVAVAMFGSYLTGGIDGKATWDMLSADGQAELKAHKLLGIYLVYGSLALVVLKLLFMAIKKTVGKVLFILILGGFIAVTLNQGKEGGELVYKYGANNEAVAEAQSTIEDLTEEQDELKEKISELEEAVNSQKVSTPAPTPTAVIQSAPAPAPVSIVPVVPTPVTVTPVAKTTVPESVSANTTTVESNESTESNASN